MAKKDRFPDAYSGGYVVNEESEGSGCLGHDRNETRGYENTSGPRKKWIKLSSASHDGFGVPIRSIPLPALVSSEKEKWLLRLRSELDQVRGFQKRVDVDRAQVTVSSSSNVVGCSNGQGNQTNVRKSVDPQAQKVSSSNGQGNQTNVRKSVDPQAQKVSSVNRGAAGRPQSVNEPANPAAAETFSLLLRKQCETLLKKLMTHQHSWVFNKPVDVVALKIPDYFNVIKKPMDLGTIKTKLCSGSYSSPSQFAADVRLTFSNAMTYNPPGNDVHIMADVLSKFFELRWKPIEKKLPVNGSQQLTVHEEIDLVKPMPSSKKRKMTSVQPNVPNLLAEPSKPVMSNDDKVKLSRELLTHLGDLPDNIINFLRQHGSNKNDAGEDEIEIDIDNLNNETVFELRKMLDDHIREKQNHAKAEPCVIELLNESGLSNSTMQLYKGNDLADEDVDVAGNEPPVSSYPSLESDKGTNVNNTKEARDSDSSSSENELKDVKASSSFSGAKEETTVAEADLGQKTGMTYPVENRPASALDHAEQNSQQKPNSIELDSQKDDGDSAPPSESQVSPDKLYRAALLKNRFADTILKAREKTFNQDEKADPEKLRREKEQLENQKRKEKARLQAEAKAAENARRRVEAEAAAEAKRKRDLEREAARQALLKMEKTVEIDETSRFLKDLEMLRTADPEQLLPSCLDEISPEHESQDGLGSFNFGSSNPLEQLGLYMKRDEHEDEDEEETELEPAIRPEVVNNDVEEGEIK
ncbi:putative chromatin remodeler Bromodomain family [Helianthus annuus]|nr:putative chromatin remodeler Bromodomain family [Helianthus annuus]KAJ0542372.1 putative chromatin remodeler Bromodomain family [Helianthus annuus]KAJ0888168.1 putative chromatin remodeler Bromodomain family [Helianthus annuus]KAJ0893072.1 putative chromatin remodeler Bromodomain family [Helianthus annuus]